MERLGLERLLHTHLVAGYSMAALQTVWEGSGTGVGRGGEKVGGGGQEEGADVCTQKRARARTHTHTPERAGRFSRFLTRSYLPPPFTVCVSLFYVNDIGSTGSRCVSFTCEGERMHVSA